MYFALIVDGDRQFDKVDFALYRQQMKIVILNGSLGGARGNTAQVITQFLQGLSLADSGAHANAVELDFVHLADAFPATIETLKPRLAAADAFLFATGTYWDSWGSPLQKFLELATPLEADEVWLGKPAAVIVTMHSVGGKEVLSRLQGVLCTFGLWLPPMSGFVYSLANHLALKDPTRDGVEDLWQLDDLALIAKNLRLAAREAPRTWAAWPVDRKDPRRRWL